MSLRAPLARSLRLRDFEVPRKLPSHRRVEITVLGRRWVCQDCRRESTRTIAFEGQRILSTCQFLDSAGYPTGKRRSAFYAVSTIRHLTTSRQLQKDEESNDDKSSGRSGSVAQTREPLDQKVHRMVEITRKSWNELVGYTDIEKERKRVEMQEELIEQKRLELQEARDSYRVAVDKHAMSLRESRDLLGRKDEWSESDAARFAALHTMVKTNEQAEYGTRQALQAAELGLEREIERLSSKIGAVYQAESMYNSKILQMKTWWTWALFLFNASVFVFNLYLLQVGLNPMSKKAEIVLSDDTVKRLSSQLAVSVVSAPNGAGSVVSPTQTITEPEQALGPLSIHNGSVFYKDSEFEIKPSDTISLLKEILQTNEGIPLAKLRLVMDGAELEDARAFEEFPADVRHTVEVFAVGLDASIAEALGAQRANLPVGDSLSDRTKDLFSDRTVSLKMREVTSTILQSALAGAVMASLVAMNMSRG